MNSFPKAEVTQRCGQGRGEGEGQTPRDRSANHTDIAAVLIPAALFLGRTNLVV